MAETTFFIEKLNGDNYFVSKYKIELLVIKEGLWEIIEKNKPADAGEHWKKKDNQARATICLSVEDKLLVHVRKAKSALNAWHNLKAYYEKSTLSNKVMLIRQICCLKLDDKGDIGRVH